MATLEKIINSERYQKNLDWGEARPGHPEGTVRAHIAELESNLDAISESLSPDSIDNLRLLIHTHDTFKGEASPGVPIADSRSHASIAREFLAEFEGDADILNMVQYHDEPFALWRQFEAKGKYNSERWEALMEAVQDWELFATFLIIDGLTDGKDDTPLRWFLDEVSKHKNLATDFNELIRRMIARKSLDRKVIE